MTIDEQFRKFVGDAVFSGTTSQTSSDEPLTLEKIRQAMDNLTPPPIPASIRVGSLDRFSAALGEHGAEVSYSTSTFGGVDVRESHIVPEGKAVINHGNGKFTIVDLGDRRE